MAELLIHVKRSVFKKGKLVGIMEIKIWKVPKSECFPEGYKYSLTFARYSTSTEMFDGDFLRYDNYRCEGHHRHIKGSREPYRFADIEKLLDDFKADFKKLLEEVEP